MACEFPYRCGRLDCELLYPNTLLFFFTDLALTDKSNFYHLCTNSKVFATGNKHTVNDVSCLRTSLVSDVLNASSGR